MEGRIGQTQDAGPNQNTPGKRFNYDGPEIVERGHPTSDYPLPPVRPVFMRSLNGWYLDWLGSMDELVSCALYCI